MTYVQLESWEIELLIKFLPKSLWPSDLIHWHKPGLSLTSVIAWPESTKSFPETILTYYELNIMTLFRSQLRVHFLGIKFLDWVWMLHVQITCKSPRGKWAYKPCEKKASLWMNSETRYLYSDKIKLQSLWYPCRHAVQPYFMWYTLLLSLKRDTIHLRQQWVATEARVLYGTIFVWRNVTKPRWDWD